MNPAKLTSIIRFHLSDLGARNAHHEFEHLARHTARARIASNILPATGPVSSGGDQSRDFETFDTKHAAPGPPGSRFAAHSTGSRKIVFACSLQKTIATKIRKDVRALAEQGGIDEVAYFCEANLPIAKRLKLIDEATAKGLTLQIFDGNAIAEWLTEPDIFWIAQEYLHLPSEVAPAGKLEQGYLKHRDLWRTRAPIPINRNDFLEIKSGLRKATFDDSARADLGLWLDKMAAFLDEPAPRNLVRNAMYEIAVANLRGKGDLNPITHLVADYYSDVEQHTSIGEITDSVVLLQYCFGAYGLDQYEVNPAELFERRQNLVDLFDRWLVQSSIGPGRRSGLLRMRGSLEFTPETPDLKPNHDQAFAYWNDTLDSASEAPLFPIEEFADHLGQMVEYMGEVEALLALASRADELLANRVGAAAAGEKAIDRALSLLDRDEPEAAIRELHKAKAKWFSGEQLAEMLRLLLLLAEQYGQLGLAYASKYHSMAAAYIARYEDPERVGDLLPLALLELLDAEDAAGNSLGYLQLFPVLLAAHVAHDAQPLDMNKHPRIQENMGQLAALLGFLKRGNQQARKCVDPLAVDWPPEIKEPIWKGADRRNGFWNKGSWNKAWSTLENAMLDRPFGDLGLMRRISWTALGIDWNCEFANNYTTTPAAEQVIAELQLMACAMAGRDLGVVPSAMTLKLESEATVEKLEFSIPDNDRCEIQVRVPLADRSPNDSMDSIALFAAVLHCCSVLPDQQLMNAFDKTVFKPIFVGRPYADLYREFVPADLFAEDVRIGAPMFEPDRNFNSIAGERVAWFDGPGPTYNSEEAVLDIAHRYRRVQASLAHTLERLKADPQAMVRLRILRAKGMKDWEILSILSNVAINHRLNEQGNLTPEQWRDQGLRLIDKAESAEEALAPDLFSTEQLELHAPIYLGAFLDSRQLRAPLCFNPESLERFLVVRYRLREDDVDHDDVFGWSDQPFSNQ
ncbi:hypothetical protein [Parasphingorhabdus sp.]|uniref:hypothetical protein n=1 Tax=Parasphingorhabdus sp. TaxID=2709688 RepID=UPI003D2D68BF